MMVVTQSGCMTIGPMAAQKTPVAEVAQQSANGMYKVDMLPLVGNGTSFQGQIRSNMTVQNALEESGALKSVRNANITVFRIVRGSGKTLKLPVNLQSRKKLVRFEEDYALHPGDRIVVKSGSATGLDKMIESVFPQSK